MELIGLRIENLRLIERLELDLAPGWNLFLGSNGAGKTSLLEAAFLLSHGRSFRTSARDALVRHGSAGYSVFGELRHPQGAIERVGVARSSNRLEAKLNGEPVPAGELLRHTAVLCFEPGSHELIRGSSEERRRFLDWGVFHVEHDFLQHWRRYQRALKQRNALLRRIASEADLDVWDRELVAAAEPLTAMRLQYFAALRPVIVGLLFELLGELGEAHLHFEPGFDDDRSLTTVLCERRGATSHVGTRPRVHTELIGRFRSGGQRGASTCPEGRKSSAHSLASWHRRGCLLREEQAGRFCASMISLPRWTASTRVRCSKRWWVAARKSS